MKLYVSGPMSGIAGCNIPAFDAAAEELRERGHEVVSPAELDEPAFRDRCLALEPGERLPDGETWGALLARDTKLIADDGIEAVTVLPGWHRSRGANLETFVARLCGIPVLWKGDLNYIGEEQLRQIHGRACGVRPRRVLSV
jgi:hypothetical protein